MDLQQALQEPGTGEEDMSEALSTLAMQAYERFLEAGYISDIHLAVETARLGLKVVPDTSSHKAGHLNKLGVFLGSRYERTGEMEDLEEAISISIQVVNLTSDDHPHRAGYLHNLGSKLGRRYKQTGDVEDLEEAIKIARQAVNIRSDDHPHRAEWLSNLANRLESRYELTGDMEDLEEAIRTASQAVDATPHDHADRAGWLSNLGNKFQRRYERTGELRDLEEAIKIARQAVDVTPDDHPDRAGWLSNLGSKLGSRYERTGEMADLEEAITTSRQAVNLTSDDHVDRTAKLNNLGSKLVQRYERIGEVVDLEEAIRIARQVVNLTPDGHIDRAARLSNLGNMLQSRYEQKGKMEDRKMEDLEEAIRTVRQAVNLTSDDHPDRACWLSNLANKLQSKYERTGKMENLEEAITMARQAVNLTSEDHPDRACWLRNLGNKLESRYERTGEMRDLEEASAYLLEAWSCLNAVPFHRVMAAARCLKLLAKQHRVAQSIDLGRRILDLLPSVHTRALNRNDQQFVVSTFAGIASNLCSFLLSANRLSEALECLEQGRTIIISRLLDDRSDLSSLRQDHFQLANRYQSLVDEVNAPTRQTIPGVIETLLRKRRQEAAVELDMCLKEIRRVSGHERFMLGQTVAEMQECITEECKYSHSGATQAELIAGTLRKFNITAQSLGYYIGDNATSNDTCLEELSKVLEAESGAEYPHKRRRIRCIGHIINLALQAFLLARSKEALRAALEATADEPGSTMLEEFSQQLHELDPAEIAAHSDTTTHQEKRQEERQEQPTRKPTHARGKRAATTHQQASNVDERFAGWQGIPALAKLHALAVYIRSSALHNDQWYDAVGKQLGIDNITRWSSWHRVITVALKKKPQIIQFTAEHDNDLEGNTLSSRDWEMLERTLEFLQPFYEATLEAEGAMASISQSLELLDLLLGHCEKWKAHYSQPSNRDDRIIHSIDMCWFILDKYYTMTEDVPVYAAALLLDPSKRKSYIEECWPEEWHEGAFAAARSLWKEEYNYDVEIHLSEQSLAVPALLKRKKDTMLSKMRLEVRNKTMARARGKDDFDSFISEAPIALAEDTTPLQWWCSEDVRTAYPRLSRMAIDILSVPAESAEPERTFSGARRTARITSSYTPSIKALGYAQKQSKRAQEALVAQDTGTMLIAAMPTTPKGPGDKKAPKNLPGVEEEMREILNLTRSHMRTTAYTHPSTDQALEVLKACHIAHFACHGTSDYSDPSNSGLILQKSTGPEETLVQNRLTVQRVSDLRLRYAQIAYLSACSTAENKAARLSDEVIHVQRGGIGGAGGDNGSA
ncbi:hypothetical protein FOFC_16036 [Fusarium oxysporum]|nr:hypothetical protein FOFC_16036 [Fusarium oxysporum]